MAAAPAIAPVLGGYATAWMGWRAAFALLAIVGGVTLAFTVLLLPETNALQSGTRASLLLGSLRLFRSRAFCGYVLGGACTTTSFYAFMAASPFILVDLLHQPTERVGLYYLLLMAGVAAGGLSANRLAGRIRAQVALRIANSLAIAGAAGFMLVDLAGWLNVVTVIAPIVVFMVGAGMASPFALTGAVSVNPHAIGAASGLYGFTQMAYGALCTVIVEVWRPGSVFPVAVVLLASALLGRWRCRSRCDGPPHHLKQWRCNQLVAVFRTGITEAWSSDADGQFSEAVCQDSPGDYAVHDRGR